MPEGSDAVDDRAPPVGAVDFVSVESIDEE